MKNTTQGKNGSRYDVLEIHILRRPKDYEVIETAEKAGNIIGLKLGDDHVIAINGRQLRAIDKKYKHKRDYEFYTPPQNTSQNHKIELRK